MWKFLLYLGLTFCFWCAWLETSSGWIAKGGSSWWGGPDTKCPRPRSFPLILCFIVTVQKPRALHGNNCGLLHERNISITYLKSESYQSSTAFRGWNKRNIYCGYFRLQTLLKPGLRHFSRLSKKSNIRFKRKEFWLKSGWKEARRLKVPWCKVPAPVTSPQTWLWLVRYIPEINVMFIQNLHRTWCQILCSMRLQCVSKILMPRRMLQKTSLIAKINLWNNSFQNMYDML